MKKLNYIALFSGVLLLLASCQKNNMIVDKDPATPEFAKFMVTGPLKLDITTTKTTIKVPVGVTNVSTSDRSVTIGYTSASGAVSGTQFTYPATITIPAGQTIDSIPVTVDYSKYETGRKDTVVFKIEGSGIASTSHNKAITVYLHGPCFEGNMVLNTMKGSYPKTNETLGTSPYGPYTTTISTVTQTSATTGTVTVTNIYDFGWNPIQVELDWTDPYNVKATVPEQSGIGDAGTISSAYAGEDISVRQYPGMDGTYSYCNLWLNLKMQLGVTGLGWFSSVYTVNMAR